MLARDRRLAPLCMLISSWVCKLSGAPHLYLCTFGSVSAFNEHLLFLPSRPLPLLFLVNGLFYLLALAWVGLTLPVFPPAQLGIYLAQMIAFYYSPDQRLGSETDMWSVSWGSLELQQDTSGNKQSLSDTHPCHSLETACWGGGSVQDKCTPNWEANKWPFMLKLGWPGISHLLSRA